MTVQKINPQAGFTQLSGSGSPEGSVVGWVGQTYRNTNNNDLYEKATGDNTNTGWVQKTGSGATVPDATEIQAGKVELANQTEAEEGTDDTNKAMNPLKTKQAILYNRQGSYVPATPSGLNLSYNLNPLTLTHVSQEQFIVKASSQFSTSFPVRYAIFTAHLTNALEPLVSNQISPTSDPSNAKYYEWATNNEQAGAWYYVKLPNARRIGRLIVRGRVGSENFDEWKLQATNDNPDGVSPNWTDILGVNDTSAMSTNIDTYDIPSNIEPYQTWRMLCVSAVGTTNPGMSMFNLYHKI
jgi:hypothetical protein